MELRLKIGRYAGEIKDVAPEIARQLLDDGNATDPRFEGEVPSPQAAQVAEAAHVDELAEYRDACARSSTAAAKRSTKKGRS